MLVTLALLILCALIVFQIAAALGAPIGQFTQGGQAKLLSPAQRQLALMSAVLLLIALYALATQYGLWTVRFLSDRLNHIACWFFALLFSVNVVLNALSRSPQERLVMTPLAVILAYVFWRAALLR